MYDYKPPLTKPVNYKMVISGSMLEFYHFKGQIEFGEKPKRNTLKHPEGKIEKTEEQKKESALSSLRRAKRTIRRLIYANAYHWLKPNGKPFTPIPITLTFKENIQEIKIANKHFTTFIRKLNYSVGKTEYEKTTTKSKESILKYLGVIEFQERGAVHYHIIFFNLPFMKNIYDRIEELWGHGLINVNGKDKGSFKSANKKVNLNKIIEYFIKYITDSGKDANMFKKKKYFDSRGLLKPVTLYSEKHIKEIIRQLPDDSLTFEKLDIEIPYLISFNYYRYNLANYPGLEHDIINFINPFNEKYEIRTLLPKINRR